MLAFLSPITPLTYSHGNVEEGTYITHTFKLKNTSRDTVYIIALRRSCGCTATRIINNKRVVPPGDSIQVFVKINTRGYRGDIKKYVILYYREDGKDEEFLRLVVKAKVEKFFDTPSTVWFSTNYIIFDVREKKDYRQCHIAGSENIPPDKLINMLKAKKIAIPEHVSLYIIDYTDSQALDIVKKIRQLGYEKTYVIKGGLSAWKDDMNGSLLICK